MYIFLLVLAGGKINPLDSLPPGGEDNQGGGKINCYTGRSQQSLQHFQSKDQIVKDFIILNQVVAEKTLMKISICVV